jgi:hypothetical protein
LVVKPHCQSCIVVDHLTGSQASVQRF